MTIFFDHSGPFMRFADGVLVIEDLNPQMKTTWRMTRVERMKIGIRFLLSVLR